MFNVDGGGGGGDGGAREDGGEDFVGVDDMMMMMGFFNLFCVLCVFGFVFLLSDDDVNDGKKG